MMIVQEHPPAARIPHTETVIEPQTERRKRRGYAVLAARESRGWSLDECAKATGFSVRQIMAWEHGSHGLTLESLRRLALGYSLRQEEIAAIVTGGSDEGRGKSCRQGS